VAYQNQDGLTGWRKIQGNWVVKIGGQMPRIEDTGDICLRRPRPTQGCRADDDDLSPLTTLLFRQNITVFTELMSV
jgi:hypothetical protein